jgi:hypothetical protein
MNLAIREAGTLIVPVRGIGPRGTAHLLSGAIAGQHVLLRRERDHLIDPNAIAVHLTDGTKLGFLAREVARILAVLLNLEDGPQMNAVLAALPDGGPAALERRDAVTVHIEVIPARAN